MVAGELKKVLIGGGTGFIGKNLRTLLINNGYNPVNVSRKHGPDNILWKDLICCGLPKGLCAVVNCAGQPVMDFSKPWNESFKCDIANSRVITTKRLAACINEAEEKPNVFVVITGVGAYEPSYKAKYDESSPITGCDFFSNLSIEWEKAAEVKPPVRLVIIRSGVVIGRTGGLIQNTFLQFYLGLGGRIGNGLQYMPWIHIDDLTRLILFAIENGEVNGILNGVAPHVITNGDFTEAFAKALRRPAFCTVPVSLLNFLLSPERAMMMTQGQRVVPKRVLEYGFKYKYDNIEEACKSVSQLISNR